MKVCCSLVKVKANIEYCIIAIFMCKFTFNSCIEFKKQKHKVYETVNGYTTFRNAGLDTRTLGS